MASVSWEVRVPARDDITNERPEARIFSLAPFSLALFSLPVAVVEEDPPTHHPSSSSPISSLHMAHHKRSDAGSRGDSDPRDSCRCFGIMDK